MTETKLLKAQMNLKIVLAVPYESNGTEDLTINQEDKDKLSKELESSLKKSYGTLCESAKVTVFKILKN